MLYSHKENTFQTVFVILLIFQTTRVFLYLKIKFKLLFFPIIEQTLKLKTVLKSIFKCKIMLIFLIILWFLKTGPLSKTSCNVKHTDLKVEKRCGSTQD